MSKTKTVLATLALGTAVAFAGPAFADKMKATLDGKSEVPPTTTAGKGTADIDYDPATKKSSGANGCQTLKFTGTDLYCAPGGC